MRKHFLSSIAVIATLGLASLAGAAPLNWNGTVTIITGQYGTGNIGPFGGVATVNGSSGVIGAHLNTLRLATSRQGGEGNLTQIVTDPESIGNGVAAIIWDGIEIGGGTLAPISGGAASNAGLTQNVVPLPGLLKICLLTSECDTFLAMPQTQPTTVNGEPGGGVKGVGVGGLLTIGGGTNPVRMSLQNAPWTIKTATVISHMTTTGGNQVFTPKVFKGFAHGPTSGTTSTAQPSGVIQLVAPTQVETNLPFGAAAKQASGNILLIHFVPEPGLLLLLGSGVAGLALLGRKRVRR
jgi:hypothetical protein